MEAATFLDLMVRAGRVAPSRGAAYDKASGIVMEVKPGEDHNLVVRSTNLDVFFTTWAKAQTITGDPVTWRFHADTIQAVARALKSTGGAKVILATDGGRVQITQGRLKSKLNVMTVTDYPIWKAFNPNLLHRSGNIQKALSMIEWAAGSSESDLLIGVKADGKRIICTDRYRVGTVPYELPDLEGDPFVFKARLLSGAVSSQTHFDIGFDGDYLLLMPDELTQIKVLGLAGDFPPVERIMIPDKPCQFRVRRVSLIELVNRVLSVRGSDRSPLVKLRIGKGEIVGYMQNEDFGMFGDVIEIPGYCPHERIDYGFSHENLIAALNAAPGDDVIVGHDPGNLKSPFYFKGEQDYEAWLAVRGQEDSK